FNGIEVDTNARIEQINLASANSDNINNPNGQGTLAGDPWVIPAAANFTFPTGGSADEPKIIVENRLNVHTITTEKYPWPDITVVGLNKGGIGISNLQGEVLLKTFPAGQGDINILGPVQAKNLTVIAGGTLFIDGVTQYNAAGDPYGIWRDATTGPYPTDA